MGSREAMGIAVRTLDDVVPLSLAYYACVGITRCYRFKQRVRLSGWCGFAKS